MKVQKFENSEYYYYMLANIKKLTPAVVAGVESLDIFKKEYIQKKTDGIIRQYEGRVYKMIEEARKVGEIDKNKYKFKNFRASILEACSKKDWSISVLVLDEILRQVKIRKEIWKEVEKAQEEEDI